MYTMWMVMVLVTIIITISVVLKMMDTSCTRMASHSPTAMTICCCMLIMMETVLALLYWPDVA